MTFEKGDSCPFDGCDGILVIDKSSGKCVITCRENPTKHYALINQPQAAAWERGEAIEIDFDAPAPDDHWFSDFYLSNAERVA